MQGLLVLLANSLLMWTGFIMVVPLLAVHYVEGLGWPAASIGIVLAVRQFTQQGLGVFGGVLADRLGVKGLIMAGMLLRGLGFAMMAWATNFPLLILSALFAALGGALFEAPSRAAIVMLTFPKERSRYFAIQATVSSIGTALGPLLGILLLRYYSFDLVAYTSASFYVAAFFLTLLWLPVAGRPVPEEVGGGDNQNVFRGLRLALHDRLFMIFTALSAGMWFMWVQFSVALPLQATAITGNAAAVSWTYMVNAGLSILLQYPLVRWLSRWLSPVPMLAVGMVVMACGLGAVGLVRPSDHATPLLLATVAFYVCGSLLAMPSQQTASAELANPLALGSYFGVGALSIAVGGGLGNLAGGFLYDVGQAMAWPALPWLVFWVVGMTTGLALFWLQRLRARGQKNTAEE
jgi:DHA1 family multidrug resistance protein-like MFS transporter